MILGGRVRLPSDSEGEDLVRGSSHPKLFGQIEEICTSTGKSPFLKARFKWDERPSKIIIEQHLGGNFISLKKKNISSMGSLLEIWVKSTHNPPKLITKQQVWQEPKSQSQCWNVTPRMIGHDSLRSVEVAKSFNEGWIHKTDVSPTI